MQNTKLKSAIYVQPFTTVQSERYVVETQEDLNAFFKAFPENKIMLKKVLTEDLARGKVILLTDPTLSGFSSYCYETILGDRKVSDVHPTSYIRFVDKSIELSKLKKAVKLLADEDGFNTEYNRALCELVAELDPIEDVDTADRTQQISSELGISYAFYK